jgi:hypothetical protein
MEDWELGTDISDEEAVSVFRIEVQIETESLF